MELAKSWLCQVLFCFLCSGAALHHAFLRLAPLCPMGRLEVQLEVIVAGVADIQTRLAALESCQHLSAAILDERLPAFDPERLSARDDVSVALGLLDARMDYCFGKLDALIDCHTEAAKFYTQADPVAEELQENGTYKVSDTPQVSPQEKDCDFEIIEDESPEPVVRRLFDGEVAMGKDDESNPPDAAPVASCGRGRVGDMSSTLSPCPSTTTTTTTMGTRDQGPSKEHGDGSNGSGRVALKGASASTSRPPVQKRAASVPLTAGDGAHGISESELQASIRANDESSAGHILKLVRHSDPLDAPRMKDNMEAYGCFLESCDDERFKIGFIESFDQQLHALFNPEARGPEWLSDQL